MKVALASTAPGEMAFLFHRSMQKKLLERGIHLSYTVIDMQADKKGNPLGRALKVARRQARINGSHWVQQFLRIIFYKWRTKTQAAEPVVCPDELQCIEVPNINSEQARSQFLENKVDIVCLLGTRILSRKTLEFFEQNSIKVINVHSSDPGVIRGGPVVVWEILKRLSHITITVHEVVAELDAGVIYAQEKVPIVWRQSLADTVQGTMRTAQSVVFRLFYDVLLALKNGTATGKKAALGPVYVTPAIREVHRAESICAEESMSK